ncbi:MAG: ATP-dependent Clp protease proteolytic subunit [Candidatus Azobacteroides sp.]|nr:ATP-dependent Clp protease proteolytic subunit [Candidatus Azobacteroides sp.]
MIKVIGIIGSEKGQYSLVRLIRDVKNEPDNQPLHIVISSPGGDGELAFDMHDYLRGLNRQIITECKIQCASAASILFLAGDKRTAGCPIMIHNPWMRVEGDAETLSAASQFIGDFEKRAEKFYSDKTGLDKETISNLMKNETYISPSEAVSLGFATEAKQTAMALIHTNNNQKNKKMEVKKKGENKLRKILAILTGEDETANMMDLTAANGDIITIDREEGEPQVGDSASPDGSYVMPDGSTIVIADGVITEIIPADTSDEEIEQLRAENAQLREQLATAQAAAKTNEELLQLNAIKIAGGTEWLAKQCSHYKPAGRKAQMTGGNNNDGRESKTAQRLAELKAKRFVKS